MLRELKDGDDQTSNIENDTHCDRGTDSEYELYISSEDEDDKSDDSESRIVIAKSNNEAVYLTRSGAVQVRTHNRTSNGFQIDTITFANVKEYKHHLELLKMLREMDKKDV
jgi:hypothetical protein